MAIAIDPQVLERHPKVQTILSLDLEPIVFKLTTPEKGRAPKLTLAEADRGVELYRMFLILILVSTHNIVPTEEIDEIWHTHILDTAKYREDCEGIFGRVVDHFPYLGLRGDEDVRNWKAEFAHTCELFTEYFGVKLVGEASAACGNDCDSSLCDSGSCDTSSCDSSDGGDDLVDRTRPRPVRPPVFA